MVLPVSRTLTCPPLLCSLDPVPTIWARCSPASPSRLRQSSAIHWGFPSTFIHVISPSIKKNNIKLLLTLLSESTSTPFHSYLYFKSSFPILSLYLFFTFIKVKNIYNHCTITQTFPSSHTHPDFCSWGLNRKCSGYPRVCTVQCDHLSLVHSTPHADLAALCSWTLCVLCLLASHTRFPPASLSPLFWFQGLVFGHLPFSTLTLLALSLMKYDLNSDPLQIHVSISQWAGIKYLIG